MAHFLFVVEIPTGHAQSFPPSNVNNQWLKFENTSRTIEMPSASSKQLCRNVWLLDAKNALPILLALSSLADTNDLRYSAHLVSGEVTPLTK